jgi:hypothetical protein
VSPEQQNRHPDEGVADLLPTDYTDVEDAAAVAELAEAERAAARGGATPAQARGVQAAAQARRAEDRVAGWRSDQHPPAA